MEVVNELDFILVGYQEVSDGSGFRLREWRFASVVLFAWVTAGAGVLAPIDAIVAVEVNTISLRTTWAILRISLLEVLILPHQHNFAGLDELLLDFSDSINIDDWHDVVLILNQQVQVWGLLLELQHKDTLNHSQK